MDLWASNTSVFALLFRNQIQVLFARIGCLASIPVHLVENKIWGLQMAARLNAAVTDAAPLNPSLQHTGLPPFYRRGKEQQYVSPRFKTGLFSSSFFPPSIRAQLWSGISPSPLFLSISWIQPFILRSAMCILLPAADVFVLFWPSSPNTTTTSSPIVTTTTTTTTSKHHLLPKSWTLEITVPRPSPPDGKK